MKRSAVAALLAGALALPGLAWAVAEEPIDAAVLETEKEQWQSRFHAAREAVAAARESHRAALDAYTKMRHRGKPRGEAKQRILEELSSSEEVLAEAEAALEEMFETARRAGLPPGWMRMQRGGNPAAPEPSPEDTRASRSAPDPSAAR
jgi:hypothetical protein